VTYLLDTGPLVSALAREEPRFGTWAKNVLSHLPRPLYTCEAVLTEAAHFLGDAGPVLAAVADGLLVCPWGLCEHTLVSASWFASTPVSRWILPMPAWSP
jgi:hypothetical protein